MKRKLLFALAIAFILCMMLAIGASAETYYVDKDGNLVDSTSDDIAYEYDCTNNYIPSIYLYDETVTKIIIPDMEGVTGSIQLQSSYQTSLCIYMIDDKETKSTNLATQITEVEVHESIYMDGAYNVGTFAGYTGLEKISFYAKVGVASKGGFWKNCSKLTEVHFYGQNLAISSVMLQELPYNKAVNVVFHENATGTISTSADTLPTYASLGGWKIVINPNITPSNTSDGRLGKTWGQVTSTTGWELVMACNPSLYTETELEALKTSHGFCSRAGSVETATVKEATVMSYCDAIYGGEHSDIIDDGNCETEVNCTRCGHLLKDALSHNLITKILYADGFDKAGVKICDCTNENCTSSDTSADAPAIFKALGYSIKESAPYTGIYTGYQIENTDAYDEYVNIMGKIKLGIVVANANGAGSLVEIGDDGECTLTAEKGLIADMSGTDYEIFKLSMTGFNSSIADSLKLIISAYTVADYDGDGACEIKFIQHEMQNEDNAPMNGFNTITLNRVYYNLYPEKKEQE